MQWLRHRDIPFTFPEHKQAKPAAWKDFLVGRAISQVEKFRPVKLAGRRRWPNLMVASWMCYP